LTDHLMFANRINHELAGIESAGQPVTLEELVRTYPEVSPKENAATLLRPTLATLLLPKSDPKRVLQVAGSNALPTHTWSSEMTNRISNYLAESAIILAELHRAGTMTQCHYDIDLSKGFEMEMRHLVGLIK